MGHPPPGKGERIENIITGSSRGRATLSRAAALKTQRGIRDLSAPSSSLWLHHSLPTFEERGNDPASLTYFQRLNGLLLGRGGSFFHRYCAPLRIGSPEYTRPFPTWWSIGKVGDWKLARNFLLVNTRNFFPPLSLPLNGIDDVVKAYYYLEDGEDNIFIDDNKFYFLFFERIKNILKL